MVTARVEEPRVAPSSASLGSMVAFPLTIWLIWRLGQAVVLAVAGGDVVADAFRFDAGWYLTILDVGYVVTDTTFETHQNAAFFPGLVWLTEPFSWLLGDRTSAILVANLTSATAFVAVYGATGCSIRSDRVARRSVIGLAVWPASVVMTAFYSEGLFVTASAAAIWAAGRDRHALGCGAAFVAGITRPIGFLLGPVVAVARCVRLRRVDRVAVAYACSGPIGVAVVGAVQAIQLGDAVAFAKAQEAWGRGLAAPWLPFSGATEAMIDQFPDLAMESGVNLAAMVLVGWALVVATKRLRGTPSAWGVLGWGWVAWFAPLWTGGALSQVRLVIAAWPALVVVGGDDSRWAGKVRIAAAVVSVAISVVFIRRWAAGEFIG